jgi:hypothetical protein
MAGLVCFALVGWLLLGIAPEVISIFAGRDWTLADLLKIASWCVACAVWFYTLGVLE